MTGSTLFSFGSTKRKAKPLRDHISDPLSPAEIRYMEAKAADDASRSPRSTRNRAGGLGGLSAPTLANISASDAESKYSLFSSGSPERLQNGSARLDRHAASRPVSNPRPNRLRKEQSSCTLRSYYDRKQLPVAVSQQTSASSARDFALRKGFPPVIPTLHRDISCPQSPNVTNPLKHGTTRKRPSRIDFSMLFPKPLPQSGPMLSPRRYTDSPPPLSENSEMPFRGPPSQSLQGDGQASNSRHWSALRQTQASHQQPKKVQPSFIQPNVQKPRKGVLNWFDGLEGNISEDEADCEPNMQPQFVETAFPLASPQTTLDGGFQASFEPENRARANCSTDQQSTAHGQTFTPQKATHIEEPRLRDALDKWQVKTDIGTKEKLHTVGRSSGNTSTVLDLTDLHEESVLCLSSSDDEEEDVRTVHRRHIFDPRAPLIRDSLGVESLDSDIEIGTAQAVNTSFLRTFKSPAQPNDLRHKPSTKTRSKAQRLKAVEIPDRRSSRLAAPLIEPRTTLSNSDDGNLEDFLGDQGAHQSTSSGRSIRTLPAAANSPGTLMMALTPQEVSLLEAMRSTRASMRHNTHNEAHDIVTNDESPPQSSSALQPSVRHNFQSSCSADRFMRLNANVLELKKSLPPKPALTEPSVPSGRASLIFSECVSSPTTGRESPATPTLELHQEVSALHGLGEFHDPGLHTVKSSQFGHTRCSSGGNQILVLEPFQQPEKETASSDEYSWMISQFNQRNRTAQLIR
jgi:hypothetical protein